MLFARGIDVTVNFRFREIPPLSRKQACKRSTPHKAGHSAMGLAFGTVSSTYGSKRRAIIMLVLGTTLPAAPP
jgi:hypothetical protein